MGYVIFFGAIAILVIMIIVTNNLRKEAEKKNGWEKGTGITLDEYISGHPNIDRKFKQAVAYCVNNRIDIADMKAFKKVAEIPFASITKIEIEDQSTLEKRISLTRVALVGVLALAWQKKKKNELVYLTIYWNDGRFDHETLFQFEGIQPLTRANESRNKLIKAIS